MEDKYTEEFLKEYLKDLGNLNPTDEDLRKLRIKFLVSDQFDFRKKQQEEYREKLEEFKKKEKEKKEEIDKDKQIKLLTRKVNTLSRKVKKKQSTFSFITQNDFKIETTVQDLPNEENIIANLDLEASLQNQESTNKYFGKEDPENKDEEEYMPECTTKTTKKKRKPAKKKIVVKVEFRACEYKAVTLKEAEKKAREEEEEQKKAKEEDKKKPEKKEQYLIPVGYYMSHNRISHTEEEKGFEQFFNEANLIYIFEPNLVISKASMNGEIERKEGVLEGFKTLAGMQFHPEIENECWLLAVFAGDTVEWRPLNDFFSFYNLKKLIDFPLPSLHTKYMYKKVRESLRTRFTNALLDVEYQIQNMPAIFTGNYIICSKKTKYAEICAIVMINLGKTSRKIHLPFRKLPQEMQDKIIFPDLLEFSGKTVLQAWHQSILRLDHKGMQDKLFPLVAHCFEGPMKEFCKTASASIRFQFKRDPTPEERQQIEVANTVNAQIEVLTRFCGFKHKETYWSVKIESVIAKSRGETQAMLWSPNSAGDTDPFYSAINYGEVEMNLKHAKKSITAKIIVFKPIKRRTSQ